MKTVYRAIDEGYLETELVNDDYTLQSNETFDTPEEGIQLPVHFTDGKIVAGTDAEREAMFPTIPDEVPESASLALQVAKDKQEQEATNASLLLEIAKNKGGKA